MDMGCSERTLWLGRYSAESVTAVCPSWADNGCKQAAHVMRRNMGKKRLIACKDISNPGNAHAFPSLFIFF
jgi:hypothetical protein